MSGNGEIKAGDVRKELVNRVNNGEDVEKTPEFWKHNDEMKIKVLKIRGTAFLKQEEGRKEVEHKLNMGETMLKEMIGWQTLKETPQGEELFKKFKTELRDIVAQGLASKEHLNGGYGLKGYPKEPETPKGQVNQDGLLTPGATPENAVDVDDEENDATKALNVRRGQHYEDKLRIVTDLLRNAHVNDMFRPFKLLAFQILWTFKKSAQDAHIWNVYQHHKEVPLPHADDEDESIRIDPGSLVACFFPYEAKQTDLIFGLDNGAVSGWLFAQHIEMLYKWGRPEPREGAPFYLPMRCTILLDQTKQAKGGDLHLHGATLVQLAQQMRDYKEIGMDKLIVAFDHQAFRIPMSTKCVFFCCNPDGNHWIVVSGIILTDDNGRRSGKITVHNSIASQGLDGFFVKLRRYFAVLSAIEPSPLHGIDWLKAPVVPGPSVQQYNSSDCGLLAIDNLLALASGDTPPHSSDLTPLERREKYMGLVHAIAEEVCGHHVGGLESLVDDAEGDQGPSSHRLYIPVKQMADAFKIEHWQYMIARAQPHLTNDFAGQLRNIERLLPRILGPHTVLAPVTQVCLPDGAIPRAALVLNDHDVASARPDPRRTPDLVVTIVRGSWFKALGSDMTQQSVKDSFIDTYYPGTELDFMHINTVHSSNLNFLGLTASGTQGYSKLFKWSNAKRELVQPFIDRMDIVNSNHDSSSGKQRPLVAFVQAGIDGSTTEVRSLGIAPQRWTNVDFSLHVYSMYGLHERQPLDAACEPDVTGRHTFAHYWLHELASRANADNFSGLGPHLDSHNQFVYLLKRIGEMKLSLAGTAGKGLTRQWPIEKLLTNKARTATTKNFDTQQRPPPPPPSGGLSTTLRSPSPSESTSGSAHGLSRTNRG